MSTFKRQRYCTILLWFPGGYIWSLQNLITFIILTFLLQTIFLDTNFFNDTTLYPAFLCLHCIVLVLESPFSFTFSERSVPLGVYPSQYQNNYCSPDQKRGIGEMSCGVSRRF